MSKMQFKRFIAILFLLIISQNSIASLDISCKSIKCTSTLHVYSGYSKPNCIKTLINDKIKSFPFYEFNLLYEINLSMINSLLAYNRYLEDLQSKIEKYKPNNVIFYNFFLNTKLLEYLNYNNIKYFTVGTEITDSIQLKYNFDKLFEFLDKLDIEYNKKIYYIHNQYTDVIIPETDTIRVGLEEYCKENNLKLENVQLKSTSELVQLLDELNRAEKTPYLLFFNLDYIVSNHLSEILPIPEIFDYINTYNLVNVPINISTLLCNNNNLMAINLFFDFNDVNILNIDTGTTLNSKIVIKLIDFYRLNLLINTDHERLYSIFYNVDLIK